MLAHERIDFLVLLKASFFCPTLAFCFDVHGLCYGPDRQNLKSIFYV